MNTSALVFMIVSWGVILFLLLFCLVRTFRRVPSAGDFEADQEEQITPPT